LNLQARKSGRPSRRPFGGRTARDISKKSLHKGPIAFWSRQPSSKVWPARQTNNPLGIIRTVRTSSILPLFRKKQKGTGNGDFWGVRRKKKRCRSWENQIAGRRPAEGPSRRAHLRRQRRKCVVGESWRGAKREGLSDKLQARQKKRERRNSSQDARRRRSAKKP